MKMNRPGSLPCFCPAWGCIPPLLGGRAADACRAPPANPGAARVPAVLRCGVKACCCPVTQILLLLQGKEAVQHTWSRTKPNPLELRPDGRQPLLLFE